MFEWLHQSSVTGKTSTSKLWRHVCFGVMTYVVVANAQGIDPWLLLVYGAIVGGSEIAKRAVDRRFGSKVEETK